MVKTQYIQLYSSLIVPVQTTAYVHSVTTTSITISFSVATGSVVTSYEVMWETDDVGGCSGGSDMDSSITTDDFPSYNITGLQEDSTYSITVTASNSAGSSEVSNTVTAMTMEAGERYPLLVAMFY